MWMCGAATSVHAIVWRDEKIVFDEDLDKCNSDEYIRQVRFKNGIDIPEVIRRRGY